MTSKVAAWPITAIQRMRTSFLRLTETSVPGVAVAPLFSGRPLMRPSASWWPAISSLFPSGQLPRGVAQSIDIDRRAMAARRATWQLVRTLKAALAIELDHIARRIAEKHQRLDAAAGPEIRTRNPAT